MDFVEKRVLVTGASRGIGFAIARAFLDAGARVAINGKSSENVATAIDRLGGVSERLIAAPADIGTVAGCELAVQTAVDAFDGLDILVNSAGIGAGRPIEASDEAMWHAHVDVNLKGTFFCCRAALPELRKSGGNIVNIGSDAGLMGCPGITVYCASKGGVVNMTRAMAIEVAPVVRVNCVCPGYVDTEMNKNHTMEKMANYAPLKRVAEASEIAHGVLYLASQKARFITGISLAIDGGTTAGH